MAICKASAGLLRNHIRAAASQTTYAATARVTALRGFSTTHHPRTYEDDSSGELPPSKSGAAETLRRNWIPIGGTALLIAGCAYFLYPKAYKDTGKDTMSDLETKTSK